MGYALPLPSRRALLASTAGLMLAGCGRKAPEAPSLFDGVIGSFEAEMRIAEPEVMEAAGLELADKLGDRSSEGIDIRRAGALRRMAQLRMVEAEGLAPAQRLTLNALAAQATVLAQGARFTFGRFGPLSGFSPYSVDHVNAALVTLPGHLNLRLPSLGLADMPNHLARLRAVATALDQETARLRADAASGLAPPLVVIDRALALAGKVLARAPDDSAFVEPLRRRMADILGPPTEQDTPAQAKGRGVIAQAAAVVANTIYPAYRRATQALSDLRPRAAADLSIQRAPEGAKFYAAALSYYTSPDLTAEAIRQIGLERGKAVAAQLDMMLRSQGLTDGAPGARLAVIAAASQAAAQTNATAPSTAPGPETPFAATKAHLDRANAQIGRWFSTPAAKLSLVSWTEDAPHQAYQPASADGKRDAALYVNGVVDGMDIGAWTHRYAVPGEHMAASIVRARKDLPLARRLIFVPAFAEGWRCYAGQLADEMGLFERDPSARLGYLRGQARAAARLVVDTGIHANGWSYEQARLYFAEATGDPAAAIDREIADIAATPGLGCAGEIGRREIVRLRDRARAALGPRFDIRDFHAALLSEGQLPLPVLAAHIENWMAEHNKVL